MIRPRTFRSALAVAALAVVLIAPRVATAQEYTAARKCGRGLAGMALGFLDIPGNMVRESREDGALSGVTVGLARGLGDFVTRELVGVYEFLSAPFELPAGFEPIMEPEYPWQYFDEATSRPAALAAEIREIPGVSVASRGNALVVTVGEGLLFRTGSATLAAGASDSLAALASALRRDPGLSIAVLGHTDNTGSAAGNLVLSAARAEAVARELTRRGVASNRLSVQGLGAADPVASNATAAGRRLNRRVEIELR